MAGQTTWNKATVPAGTDPWNAVPDVKKALDTAGLVFSVANVTEQNGLAALAPGGVLPIPTLIHRVDMNAYMSWNGTSWKRLGPTFQANTQTLGSGMATDAFTTGLLTPIIQSGSAVAATDASGYMSFNYPVAFPNGVISLMVSNGDSAQGRDLIISTAGSPITQTLGTGFASVVDKTGAAKASLTLRVNWIAVGW